MLKVFSSKQLKLLDQKTIEKQKITSLKLMKKACDAFLKWFEPRFSKSDRIKIFCGSGNNGGDALCISRMLLERNYKVKVFFFQAKKTPTKECLFHLEELKKKKILIYDINNISIS